MSLLTAIFLIICTSVMLERESYMFKKIDLEIEERLRKQDRDMAQWIQDVVDEDLEYNVSIHPGTSIFKKILNEIGIEPTPIMVVAASLAQNGKIPSKIARYGIQAGSVYNRELIEKWQNQKKFILWYNEELMKHGVSEPIMFVRDKDITDVRQGRVPALPAVDSPLERGKYFWVPMRAGL